MIEIEFWPEYNSGPLWINGSSAPLAEILEPELAERLIRWNAAYADGKWPTESSGDVDWLAEGKELLRLVREHVVGEYRIVVTEPWWD